jgi:periplasmic mercuric ion binding protein
MKIIHLIIVFICFTFWSKSQTSSIVSATIAIKGNCEECKKRIENAADIKGVKRCEWQEDKQQALVIYNSQKTNLETIEKAIAASGHETAHVKANEKKYAALPDCCKYKSTTCNEKGK